MSKPSDTTLSSRISTGVAGLDQLLGGGFPQGRVYLLEGSPGTGKTTLALQFVLEGARKHEPVLYFLLSESRLELEATAASHGWSLDAVGLHEIMAAPDIINGEEPYTLFHPSEVELSDTIKTICQEVERIKPVRVVIDSLAEMRLLAQEPAVYRRQILALKHFFVGQQCTVLLLDDRRPGATDPSFQSLVHGVFLLEQHTPAYGTKRRQLEVVKLRGVAFHDGLHDFAIRTGGIVVYPRLVAAAHRRPFERGPVTSGVTELDTLLGGGLERGTSTLIMGPSGVGKSTLATQYIIAAAERGEHGVMYLFDENLDTFVARAEGLGLDLARHLRAGRVTIQQVSPAQLSPGEFAQQVRHAVEQRASVVVLDSLNGYMNAMPEERSLLIQMHELLTYLDQQGIVTLLVMAQYGLLGAAMETPVDISYLADTVLMLRYFEVTGQVRKAMSAFKKRTGGHEMAIRELRIGPVGMRVGPPLREFQGVLTGTPTYAGQMEPLLGEANGHTGSGKDSGKTR